MVVKLLRLPAVKEITTYSTSNIYLMMSKGQFPKPIKLGERAVAWRAEDISKWIESRPVSE